MKIKYYVWFFLVKTTIKKYWTVVIIVENVNTIYFSAGLSSLGVPGVPWHTQILADQLILFQPRGTDYAHLITTGTPGFSDLLTDLFNL